MVRFLDAAQHFLIQLLLQSLRRFHHGISVGVLGLQISFHLGILPIDLRTAQCSRSQKLHLKRSLLVRGDVVYATTQKLPDGTLVTDKIFQFIPAAASDTKQ